MLAASGCRQWHVTRVLLHMITFRLLRTAELFERATTLEPKSETVLFRYAVYLDEVGGWVGGWELQH